MMIGDRIDISFLLYLPLPFSSFLFPSLPLSSSLFLSLPFSSFPRSCFPSPPRPAMFAHPLLSYFSPFACFVFKAIRRDYLSSSMLWSGSPASRT
ncbi:hypothetical protein BJX70DRAFT_371332 [Aspergillus crustosus]